GRETANAGRLAAADRKSGDRNAHGFSSAANSQASSEQELSFEYIASQSRKASGSSADKRVGEAQAPWSHDALPGGVPLPALSGRQREIQTQTGRKSPAIWPQ